MRHATLAILMTLSLAVCQQKETATNGDAAPTAVAAATAPALTPEQLGELGGLITNVQGTGLLFSCELSPAFKCYGAGSTEEWLRERGIGVIHGGANSLRFTPTFTITSAEIDLLVGMVGKALREGPRQQQAAAA